MQQFNPYMKNRLTFSYEISRACNLRCSYCYALSYLNQKQTHDDSVAKLVADKIAKFLKDYPDWHFELDILGGDPFSAPNIFEFLDMILPLGFDVWIVTNLIPTDQSKIVTLKEYLLKYPNLGVAATWHDELKEKQDEKYKSNMLYLKDATKDFYITSHDMMSRNIVASFVLFDDNERMLEKAKWLVDNDITYGLTHLYSDQQRAQKYTTFSDATKWVYEHAANHKNKYYIDDKQLTPEEFEEEELYQLSYKYHTICEPLNFHITYFGAVESSCKYQPRIEYDLKTTDITPKRIYCSGYDCYCSAHGYKELYGLKDKPGPAKNSFPVKVRAA